MITHNNPMLCGMRNAILHNAISVVNAIDTYVNLMDALPGVNSIEDARDDAYRFALSAAIETLLPLADASLTVLGDDELDALMLRTTDSAQALLSGSGINKERGKTSEGRGAEWEMPAIRETTEALRTALLQESASLLGAARAYRTALLHNGLTGRAPITDALSDGTLYSIASAVAMEALRHSANSLEPSEDDAAELLEMMGVCPVTQ